MPEDTNPMIIEYIQALQDEIHALEQTENPYIQIRFKQQIAHSDKQYWYLFEANHPVSILKDTPCQIQYGKEEYAVYVVESEGRQITLSSYKKLPNITGPVRLEQGGIVLVKRLIQCLQENKDTANPVGLRMFPTAEGIYIPKRIANFDVSVLPDTNTANQNHAVYSSLTNDISFLWGLPGSGKTTVIGQIIHHLHQQNRSVLVVSHTNTAIDGALEKALKYMDTDSPMTELSCPILRIGTPARKIPNCLLLEEQAKAQNHDLLVRHKQLSEQRTCLESRQILIWPYIAKCEWLSRTKLSEIQQHQAQIASLENKNITLEAQRCELLEKFSDASRKYAQLPEWKLLQSELEKEKNNLTLIISTKADLQAELCEIRSRIRMAQDEIKKHEKYCKMKADEKEFFSEEHYRRVLGDIQAKIDTTNVEITDLRMQREKAQAIISAYLEKNRFQKVFASKSRVNNAEKDAAEAERLLPEKEEYLHQQQALFAETSAALRTLCYLHEQMRTVEPSKTKSEWEMILREAEAKGNEVQSHLTELIQREPQSRGAVDSLSGELAESSQAFSQKEFYENAIKNNHHQILQCKKQTDNLKRNCNYLLEEERKQYGATIGIIDDVPPEKLYELLLLRFSAIKQELEQINGERIPQEYNENSSKLADIYKALKEIEFALDDVKFKIIKEAPIVGTTLTTSYMNPILRGRKFDTIILDEASFASIPALWCATLLANNNVVIVGDFMQLPPIVNAHTTLAKKWLGKDVFWHSGMQAAAKNPICCPQNFIMLNDQFRMESPIANIANLYYEEYGGIRSHDELREGARKKFYSWFPIYDPGRSVHLIDTQKCEAWTSRDLSGSSRVNSFTASMNVAMAFFFIEKILKQLDPKTARPTQEPKVLIVAQYALHVERIKQLIEWEYQNRGFSQNLNYIQAGTVHSFQGMEADVVIFDLVLDRPDTNAMLFMQETNDWEIKRMLNVAVTRARFKLFVVGNFDFCEQHAKFNAFADFLKYIQFYPKEEYAHYLPIAANISTLELATQRQIICNHISFGDYFAAEIHQMRSGMTIYSPFFTESRLKQLLPLFKEAVAKGRRIKIVTKTIANRSASQREFYKYWEKQLTDAGVAVEHKNDMHEKLILVDNNILWNGSLNALSYTGRTHEIMIRYVGLDKMRQQLQQGNWL